MLGENLAESVNPENALKKRSRRQMEPLKN
jgi:hypothetical protein